MASAANQASGTRLPRASVLCTCVENVPVPLARLNDHTVRWREEMSQNRSTSSRLLGIAKTFGWVVILITPPQDLRSHTVTRIAIDHSVSQLRQISWLGHPIGTRAREYDVGKYHGAFMTSSRSPERFSQSPKHAASGFGDRQLQSACGGSILLWKDEHQRIFDQRCQVRPSSAARFFARFSRSSFNLIVVLMQSIHNIDASVCQTSG